MTANLFPLRRLLVSCFAGSVALLLCSAPVAGQGTRITSIDRRLDDFRRQNEKSARAELEREMHGRKPTAEERRQAALKKSEIKEDFENLQSIYNDVVTRLHARETLAPAYTIEVAEKISKSAHRLRRNVEFPARKEEQSVAELKPSTKSLGAVCVALLAFLTNPMFETGVIDPTQAVKARDLLDEIIRMSDDIRHTAG